MKKVIKISSKGIYVCQMSNIQYARLIAERFGDFPSGTATGWFGEDSDFPVRYLRIGRNAVVVESPWGLVAERWHDLIRSTRWMKYPAR
jgi:hypothetical protein